MIDFFGIRILLRRHCETRRINHTNHSMLRDNFTLTEVE